MVEVPIPPLENRLERFELRLRELVRSDVEFVQAIEEDLVTAGGKRIRPSLVYLSAALIGPVVHDDELALAVELLHSASLLHDDLVDDAETRRGHQAAFRKYGNAVSVLSGDYLLSRLMHLLSQAQNLELVGMFAETARELSESEVLQFQVAALETYSQENYQRIITGKTASLMRLSCEGVAVLAGSPPALRSALAQFGLMYGQAFQMRDDYLDLMGSEAQLGKPVGGDLREGKLTALTLLLLENFPRETSPIFRRRGQNSNDLETLRQLALASGLADQVVQAIAQRVGQAIAALQVFANSSARQALEQLAHREHSRLT
jgi:octaprenyl-diphosphate synthase